MKKLLMITAVCGLTFCLWIHQQRLLQDVQVQNQRLAAAAAVLKERVARADTAQRSAQQKLADLRHQLGSHTANASDMAPRDPGAERTPAIGPDASRQGGWPANAAFFYLQKQYLTNVNYKLLNGGQLTDEAAALFGMSAAEREATDKAFDELVDQFHRVEIQRMAQVPPPAGWVAAGDASPSGVQFDSALTYRIPDLTDDINSARTMFLDQLQQTLGASRSEIIATAANSYLGQNMDDLGAGDRTIGFAWQPESDGTQSL